MMSCKTLRWAASKAVLGWRGFARPRLSWLCLLLALVLVWHLKGRGHGMADVSKPLAEWGDSVPELDSFSEPDLALAVLRKHIQNLYFSCTLGQDGICHFFYYPAAKLEPGHAKAAKVALLTTALQNGRHRSEQSKLGELRGRIRSVHGELLRGLLAIHYQNGAWNDFLDSYLELLAVAPQQVEPAFWVRSALACSQMCGRTDEVLDALQHFMRFSEDSELVGRLHAAIEDWKKGRIQGLAAANLPIPESVSLCQEPGAFSAPTRAAY